MMQTEKSLSIYSRKSKFTGKGESIGNQVEMCRDYIVRCKGEDYADRIVVYEDEGFSGGNTNRPAFQQMMADAKAGKIAAIVVYRLDRISRNIGDFASLIDELGRQNIDFISISENFDTKSPMGKAMMYIASVFSQLERETIAERIRDNMHELAKTGRWLGGTTPTGFTSEKVDTVTGDGKTRSSFQLKVLPEEMAVVRAVFDLYLETGSLTKTEAELMRRRIRTKRGKEFTRFSIKAILQNPVYLTADELAYDYFQRSNADLFSDKDEFDGVHGIMAYNRTEQTKGQTTRYLPMEQWIIAVGAHSGTIPSSDWIRVQELLGRNKEKGYRQARRNEALLTGVIFCSCGSRMFPRLTERVRADGEPICSYVCGLKNRSKKSLCDQKNVRSNDLDAAVMEQIRILTENRSVFKRRLEQSRRLFHTNRDESEMRLANLRAERNKIEKMLTALIDSLTEIDAVTVRNMVAERIEALDGEMKAVDDQIREWVHLSEESERSRLEFDLLLPQLKSFAQMCDSLTLEQQRMVIKKLVRKVVWDGQCAHVYFFGAGDGEAVCHQ